MQLRGIGGAPLERFPGPTVSTVPCMLATQNTFPLLRHDSSLSGLPLFFRSVCSSFELLLLDLMLVLSSWVPLPYLWHILVMLPPATVVAHRLVSLLGQLFLLLLPPTFPPMPAEWSLLWEVPDVRSCAASRPLQAAVTGTFTQALIKVCLAISSALEEGRHSLFLLSSSLAQCLPPRGNLIDVKWMDEFSLFKALWKSDEVLILWSALREHHSS